MITIPDQCPHCGGPVSQFQDPKSKILTLWCLNRTCQGRMKEDLAVIGAREVLEIDQLGPELADKLVQGGYVVTLPDLFFMALELADQHSKDPEKFKTSLVKQGFSHVEMTKFYVSAVSALDSRDWDRWIVALNIEGIGKVLGKQLAMALGLDGFDTLCNKLLTVEGLGLEGFGDVKLKAIREWAQDPENHQLCLDLHAAGAKPKGMAVKRAPMVSGEGPCSGMVVCVTGEHLGMERETIHEHLTALGAVVKTGISKKLTHVIAGHGAGPSKLQKARDLGTIILGTEWLKTTFEENSIKVHGGGLEFTDTDVEI